MNGGMANTAAAGSDRQAGPTEIKSIRIFINQFL
jgi:hypothetical protein